MDELIGLADAPIRTMMQEVLLGALGEAAHHDDELYL